MNFKFSKKTLIIFILLMVFISLSTVSAAQTNSSDDMALSQDNQIELENDNKISATNYENVLSSTKNFTGTTFSELESEINSLNNGDVLELTKNITQNGNKTINITKSITINGNGVTLDAQGKSEIFMIYPGISVVLNNITFINGYSAYTYGNIYNYGNLTIANSYFINNTGQISPGISNAGYMNITQTTFNNNKATFAGAIYNTGYMNITQTKFNNNKANNYGGAIYNGGYMNITQTKFDSNSVDEYGGTIINYVNVIITESYFTNNKGNYSGVIYNLDTGSRMSKIINSIFINNGDCAINSTNPNIIADYNWWGQNATNYNEKPNTNIDLNNWYFLNMTAANGTATISLNNLYDAKNDIILKVDNSNLAIVNFTLTTQNATFDKNNVEISNSANVNYTLTDIPAKLTAKYDTSHITSEFNEPLGDFGKLQKLINEASDNNIINLTRNYTYIIGTDIITNGIKINKRNLTINGNGFTINAQGKSRIFNISQNSTVVLNNITFTNGYSENDGGSIDNYGNLTIVNSYFINNTAGSNGGAINSNGNLDITQTTFNNNTANNYYGGAIRSYNANVNIKESYFTNNTASWNGGAIYNTVAYNSQKNMNITKSYFTNNTANSNGGAIYNGYNCNINIREAYFTNNAANGYSGGAITNNGYMNIEKTYFTNNTAKQDGGAVNNGFGYTINITETYFLNNKANSNGGAINSAGNVIITQTYFKNNTANGNGGAIYNNAYNNDNNEITNSIFITNTDKNGYAIYSTRPNFIADYNWWGQNATNYNEKPKANIDLNNWLFLDMTASNGTATISLNNLYENTTDSIRKIDKCSLPEATFTLTAQNAKFDKNNVIVKDVESVDYEEINKPASLTASHETAIITVNLFKADPQLELNVSNVGDMINITATLIPETTQGNIIIVVDNKTYDIQSGETIQIDSLSIGKHEVVAVYFGDNNNNGVINKTLFEIHRQTPKMNVTIENNTIAIILPVNASGVALIDINETGIYAKVGDGENIIAIPDYLNPGKYNVTVKYLGNDKYLADTYYGSIDIAENEHNITVIVNGKEYQVPLINETATVQIDNITVIVNGEKYNVALVNGTATVNIENLTNVTVVINGNEYTIPIVNGTGKLVSSRFDNLTVIEGLITGTLVDDLGNAIVNATVNYKLNGVKSNTTTDDKGLFALNMSGNSKVEISYPGNSTVLPSTVSLSFNQNIRQATSILGNNYTQYAIEYNAGERGQNFTTQLIDSNGNPIANKTVLIGYNGKILERTTNDTGHASVQINLKDKNRLTFAVTFLGDNDYNATMSVYLITINQKPITITAAAKTYKATAKTKKYTVTLKTIKGGSADGKTYFAAGKKVTMKINGKTYTTKTNAKGQATFKLKITKKGKFTAVIKYAGDNTYKSASKNVKITIK